MRYEADNVSKDLLRQLFEAMLEQHVVFVKHKDREFPGLVKGVSRHQYNPGWWTVTLFDGKGEIPIHSHVRN